MSDKIEIADLYKIFGAEPERVLQGLRQGRSHEELRKSIGGVIALSDVSLTIRRGEIFILMGLSGSGKSTLIRCINRLVEPTAGRVLVNGEDVLACSQNRLRHLRRHAMAMVFQGFGLLPHMRVLENVEYGLMVRGESKRQREEKARAMLDLVGLSGWAHHYPETLSGGMRQRVGLARALATDSDLLFMDEPFSALDPLIRHDLQGQLLELQRKLQKTIVFVTHDFKEALRIGSRIAVMRKGSIVQVGTPSELVMTPADGYVAAFSREIDPTRFISAGDVVQAIRPSSEIPADLPRVPAGELLHDLYPFLARHERVVVTAPDGHALGLLSGREVFDRLASAQAAHEAAVAAQ